MGVISRAPTARGLSPADREELRDALFERVVILTCHYDPDRVGIVFRPWLYQRLRFAAIDALREWHGRNGHKRVVDERLRDAARPADLDDGGGPTLVEPDRPATAGSVDDGRDRDAPLAWLYAQGDRTAA